MGSRGAGSGRKTQNKTTSTIGRTSPTAEVFDMDAVEKMAAKKGEGSFFRTDVPALVRSRDDNGLEVHSEKGYATMVDGVPVFIQGSAGNGYRYNIYGMVAGMTEFKTLAEAKNPESIKKAVDLAKKADLIANIKEVFEAANTAGGISTEEYARITRKQRNKR